uniref:J domain-containing protein n=1 Tax=Octactis speculum TaxID=3111310 RepID=A0A7S2FT96_9STRA|mmetsp:Transcript_28918/g.39367  ORF Transcript_28918/g.39367 Transcript_28918/m.39367 type:complete len:304 (+) Transcript_28918:106-1017(+)
MPDCRHKSTGSGYAMLFLMLTLHATNTLAFILFESEKKRIDLQVEESIKVYDDISLGSVLAIAKVLDHKSRQVSRGTKVLEKRAAIRRSNGIIPQACWPDGSFHPLVQMTEVHLNRSGALDDEELTAILKLQVDRAWAFTSLVQLLSIIVNWTTYRCSLAEWVVVSPATWNACSTAASWGRLAHRLLPLGAHHPLPHASRGLNIAVVLVLLGVMCAAWICSSRNKHSTQIRAYVRRLIRRYKSRRKLRLSAYASLSTGDINRAYRKQSFRFHPDRNKDPNAKIKFEDISKARTWLIENDHKKS